jgi:hypothetical protein
MTMRKLEIFPLSKEELFYLKNKECIFIIPPSQINHLARAIEMTIKSTTSYILEEAILFAFRALSLTKVIQQPTEVK